MAGFLPAGTFVRCRSRPKEGCGTAHLPQKLSRRQCRNPLVEWQIRGVYPEARATASTPPGAWASARAPPCHSGILSQPKVLCPRCHASALVLPSFCPPANHAAARVAGGTAACYAALSSPQLQLYNSPKPHRTIRICCRSRFELKTVEPLDSVSLWSC